VLARGRHGGAGGVRHACRAGTAGRHRSGDRAEPRIERRTPAGPQGRAATGRTLEAPVQFKLVLRETRCWLVRVADGKAWPLTEARCVPANAR
jgi:hypothetical protein